MPDLVRLRNISGDDLEVPLLGNRRVNHDTVIDIPRDLFESRVWPDQTWKVETNRPAKTEGGK